MCKRQTKLNLVILSMVAVIGYGPIAKAGNLEPSAPPGPTMKTLDEVEPRIPISSLPFTISNPGSYYVTGNLTSDANGIVVGANDVTIDLMGYSLKGSGGWTAGVYVIGATRKNIEIRNGTLQNFMTGIVAVSSGGLSGYAYSDVRVINIRVCENVYGIFLMADACLVKDCIVIDCSDAPIRCGNVSEVTGNNVFGSDSSGIEVEYGSTVKDNTVVSNGRGIKVMSFCMVTGNIVTDCNDVGIIAGGECKITGNVVTGNHYGGIKADRGNTVTGNTLGGNIGTGIDIDGRCKVTDNLCVGLGSDYGIHARGSGNRIEGNNVSFSAFGFQVDSGYNLIIKNSAANNTTNYNIAANNSYGPIVNVTGVGDITGTANADHPWANFEF